MVIHLLFQYCYCIPLNPMVLCIHNTSVEGKGFYVSCYVDRRRRSKLSTREEARTSTGDGDPWTTRNHPKISILSIIFSHNHCNIGILRYREMSIKMIDIYFFKFFSRIILIFLEYSIVLVIFELSIRNCIILKEV